MSFVSDVNNAGYPIYGYPAAVTYPVPMPAESFVVVNPQNFYVVPQMPVNFVPQYVMPMPQLPIQPQFQPIYNPGSFIGGAQLIAQVKEREAQIKRQGQQDYEAQQKRDIEQKQAEQLQAMEAWYADPRTQVYIKPALEHMAKVQWKEVQTLKNIQDKATEQLQVKLIPLYLELQEIAGRHVHLQGQLQEKEDIKQAMQKRQIGQCEQHMQIMSKINPQIEQQAKMQNLEGRDSFQKQANLEIKHYMNQASRMKKKLQKCEYEIMQLKKKEKYLNGQHSRLVLEISSSLTPHQAKMEEDQLLLLQEHQKMQEKQKAGLYLTFVRDQNFHKHVRQPNHAHQRLDIRENKMDN